MKEQISMSRYIMIDDYQRNFLQGARINRVNIIPYDLIEPDFKYNVHNIGRLGTTPQR